MFSFNLLLLHVFLVRFSQQNLATLANFPRSHLQKGNLNNDTVGVQIKRQTPTCDGEKTSLLLYISLHRARGEFSDAASTSPDQHHIPVVAATVFTYFPAINATMYTGSAYFIS